MTILATPIVITEVQQYVIAALVIGAGFGGLFGWICGIGTGLRYAREESERAAKAAGGLT